MICVNPPAPPTSPRAAPSRRSELVVADKWSLWVMACRIGRNERRLPGREGPVISDAELGGAGLWRRSGSGAGLGRCEELVHDLGAGGDDGPQFAAVDDLGGAGGGVAGQAGDLLDADP